MKLYLAFLILCLPFVTEVTGNFNLGNFVVQVFSLFCDPVGPEIMVQDVDGNSKTELVTYQERIDSIQIGTVISIRAFISKKFYLSLHSQENPDIISMMICIDTPKNEIGFNAHFRQKWDFMETRRLFKTGSRMVFIKIEVQKWAYMVILDDEWTYVFNHRHSSKNAHQLSFSGEVDVRSVVITHPADTNTNSSEVDNNQNSN